MPNIGAKSVVCITVAHVIPAFVKNVPLQLFALNPKKINQERPPTPYEELYLYRPSHIWVPQSFG